MPNERLPTAGRVRASHSTGAAAADYRSVINELYLMRRTLSRIMDKEKKIIQLAHCTAHLINIGQCL